MFGGRKKTEEIDPHQKEILQDRIRKIIRTDDALQEINSLDSQAAPVSSTENQFPEESDPVSSATGKAVLNDAHLFKFEYTETEKIIPQERQPDTENRETCEALTLDNSEVVPETPAQSPVILDHENADPGYFPDKQHTDDEPAFSGLGAKNSRPIDEKKLRSELEEAFNSQPQPAKNEPRQSLQKIASALEPIQETRVQQDAEDSKESTRLSGFVNSKTGLNDLNSEQNPDYKKAADFIAEVIEAEQNRSHRFKPDIDQEHMESPVQSGRKAEEQAVNKPETSQPESHTRKVAVLPPEAEQKSANYPVPVINEVPRFKPWNFLSSLLPGQLISLCSTVISVKLDQRLKVAIRQSLKMPIPVIMTTLFINLMGLMLPLVILQIYDRIIPNQAVNTLAYILASLAGVIIIEAALKISRAYVMGWQAVSTAFGSEMDVVSRFLRAKSQDINKDNASVWMDRFDALSELDNFYGGASRLVLLDLPFVLIFLIVCALVGGWITLIPIAVIVAFASSAFIQGTRLQNLLQERATQDGRRFDFVIESLSGIQSIKCMAMEPQIQRRFEKLQQTAAGTSYNIIVQGDRFQSIGNLFASITMISVVSVGAIFVMNGSLTIGALACCTLLSGRVIQPVLKAIGVWAELQNVIVAIERSNELLELPIIPAKETVSEDITGDITISNVTYYRDNDVTPRCRNLTLKIQAGEFVGIRGENGSGKSTLLKLIRGELTHQEGSIHIDGHNVAGSSYEKIAGNICYISEVSTLFKGTVLENITMFRNGPVLEEARTAARLIGLENDIHGLQQGYDTPLGEGVTDSLPEGLMQRIVIARVLTQKPKILLFDEANAMLDYESDRLLREGFEKLKGKVTIVIVSNRPSFLSICDRIYQLDTGVLSAANPDGTSRSETGPNQVQSNYTA